ncbi:MAG: substrate-binding domain-containing protein, partial [Bacillus sp. (in: Bacteria)]|nr:substrate-binding domain-containing protein [Bacillus sp. (in: firmicutes)]
MKSFKKLALASLMTGVFVITAACGAQGTDDTKEKTGAETKQLQGEIKVDGSSTVFPIMEAVVEEYSAVQPNVKVSVSSSGTGGGFEAFIAGETALSNASRPIKDEEIAKLKEEGIDYTELKLAYDGLSVVVNKDNDWVDQLTIDELKKIW